MPPFTSLRRSSALILLKARRNPPTGQVITGTERQPFDILKALAVSSGLLEVVKERDRLFVLKNVLPLPVQFFALNRIEFLACHFEQVIVFCFLEVREVRPAVGGARMPDLVTVGIGQIRSEEHTSELQSHSFLSY